MMEAVSTYTSQVGKMTRDQQMLATHVSLFTALFVCWQRHGFASPFSVSRKILMSLSRIASVATYHKCMRELDSLGYVRYEPSYHPRKGSMVYWLAAH